MAKQPEGDARRRQMGFTLIEMLIVVFIIGVIAALSTMAVSNTLKKGRLEQTGETVRGILGGARAQAAMNQCFVFVAVGPINTNTPKELLVIVDENRNMVPDDPIPVTGQNRRLEVGPDSNNNDITFSTVALDDLECNWPIYNGPRVDINGNNISTPYDNTYRMLAVNATGRTFNPDGAMVTETQTLTLSHRDMVEGSLRPLQRRTITVTPLYSVAVERE